MAIKKKQKQWKEKYWENFILIQKHVQIWQIYIELFVEMAENL